MFVMRECCLHQKWVTLEFSSTNLWVWFFWWQQCANRNPTISVKLGSFVIIPPCSSFLLHQSLTIVIRYYMVYLRTWLNSSNVCRMQLLVLLLFRPSSVILQRITPVLKNNLTYLLLLTRLSMDLLLRILKIFKVTTQHGILGLQRKIC